MDLSSIRKEFEIFIVDSEDSTRELLLETLTARDYKVQTFTLAEDALAAIDRSPPHLILSATHLLGLGGLDFLDSVKEKSQDMQFILMTTYADIDTAMEGVRRGAYDYLYKPFEDINEVGITVDHVIEKIYLQFQNEQLLEELQLKQKTVRKAKRKIRKEREDQQHINTLLSQMAQAPDVVQVFVENASRVLGDIPVLFLKHIPSYFTLTVTHSAVVPMSQVRGLGLNLKNEVSPDYMKMMRNPREIPSLKLLLFEVFGARDFEAVTLEGDDGVAGIVIALQKIEEPGGKRLFETYIQLLRVHYVNSALRKSLHSQATRDALSGLLNRKSFEEKLLEEVSRARRIESPVSMITIGLDHFGEFVENNGSALGDIVLKMAAS
ncbi:MAG: response regulator, partial [Bdellovibrionia bacterium]